jgi:hypothetical protein
VAVITSKGLVVAWAITQIGQAEEPPGSNRGEFVEFCQQHTWLNPGAWPWCVAFALTAVEEGAGLDYPDATAGAYDLLRRAEKRGWARGPEYKAKPGDLAVYAIGSGHAAVVEKVVGEFVHSIDGNSQDCVRRCVRQRAQVRGFIDWPEHGLPPRKRSLRFAQVVGGESGRRKLVVAGKAIPLPAAKDKTT